MLVAAIDLDHHAAFGGALLLAQDQQGIEDNVDALVVDELAEEAEAVDHSRMLRPVEINAEIDLPVGNSHAFFRRQPPVHIALGDEFRGKDEEIALLERRLQSRGA